MKPILDKVLAKSADGTVEKIPLAEMGGLMGQRSVSILRSEGLVFVEDLLNDEAHMGREPEDWGFGKRYEKKVEGVDVAGVVVRADWMVTKDDDLGTGDAPVENYEYFGIIRDHKDPTKLKFDGYKSNF